MEKRYTAKDETFYRKLILPEEERYGRAVVASGYRWFRSENVVCLEHYRAVEKKLMPQCGGTRPAA